MQRFESRKYLIEYKIEYNDSHEAHATGRWKERSNRFEISV